MDELKKVEIEELRNVLLDFEVNSDAEDLYGNPKEFYEEQLNVLTPL